MANDNTTTNDDTARVPTTADILRAARDLIADPARLTRGVFARDAQGVQVTYCSPEAACWCAMGALWLQADKHQIGGRRAADALRAAANEMGHPTAPDLNDNEPARVVEMFDRAIAYAEGRTADLPPVLRVPS